MAEKKPSVEIYREKFFPQEIILVDGIVRTGKSMLGPIVGSFEGVEIERIEPILEKIPLLYAFGKIEKDAAVSLLRVELEMRLYESMISRKANFRLKDHTSVFQNSHPLKHLRRLFLPEGDLVVERIKKEKPLFQVQQHDTLGFSQLYFEAFGPQIRILEMIRHPIDLLHSHYRKNLCHREGVDPRGWSTTIHFQGKILPWQTVGWEEEYLRLPQIDRIIRSVEVKTRRMYSAYEKLSELQKKQVLFIPFEKFVTDPLPYIAEMENFIGRKATKATRRALKKQRCPRKLSLEEQKQKEKELRALASPAGNLLIDKLIKEYEQFAVRH